MESPHNSQKETCVCVCVCVCVHVFVAYEDTNLYNDMGMTWVLIGEGDLRGRFRCRVGVGR